MRKLTLSTGLLFIFLATLSPLYCFPSYDNATRYLPPQQREDVTDKIPVIEPKVEGFIKVKDVAEYGGADWNNVIGIAHQVSLQEAAEIARNNPEITYFFYMKGFQMVLHTNDEIYGKRVFRQHDAVFFNGEPWWGSAVGYSDGYIKE